MEFCIDIWPQHNLQRELKDLWQRSNFELEQLKANKKHFQILQHQIGGIHLIESV